MVRGKFAAKGVSGPVMKEMRRPLEDIAKQEYVQSIRVGSSFNRHGKYRGLKVGPYFNYSVKVSCHGEDGGQDIFVTVNENDVDRLRDYINGTNKKIEESL